MMPFQGMTVSLAIAGESDRGEASLKNQFPLSFEGEGDTGGEVEASANR
jgi:hypothetical protein